MTKQFLARERQDLVLVELCASPDTLVRSVQAMVIEHGGCILEQGNTHPHAAALRFEIASEQLIEVYAFLLQAGEWLSTEAHEQFLLFLQCSQYEVTNRYVSLTLYSNRCGDEFDCFNPKPDRSQTEKAGPCRP